MEHMISSLLNVFLVKPDLEFKLVMIGLDSAGKTTILYKMKLDQVA